MRGHGRDIGRKTEDKAMSEQKKINIRNKRATFDYEILEEWTAGIVLVGTESKSVGVDTRGQHRRIRLGYL